MTRRQRAALLALPDTEELVVRHHGLDAADLAAIGDARTLETRLSYALLAVRSPLSRTPPAPRRAAARHHARPYRRADRGRRRRHCCLRPPCSDPLRPARGNQAPVRLPRPHAPAQD